MAFLRDLAVDHLRLRLQGVHGVLQAAVLAQIERAGRLDRADLTPLCVTEQEALLLLEDAGKLVADAVSAGGQSAGVDEEAEAELRARAQAASITLPFDALIRQFDLSAFEQLAVVLCAAPELDRSYERIYAFILDELGRRARPARRSAAACRSATRRDGRRCARRETVPRASTAVLGKRRGGPIRRE